MAEKKSPCCQSSNNEGVDNDAFEESKFNDQLSGDELQPDGNYHHYAAPHKQQRHLQPSAANNKEEIGLAGMNYRQLCNCEEDGMRCACRGKTASSPDLARQGVRIESWGRCKCIALGVFTGLACAWVLIYLSLNLARVI